MSFKKCTKSEHEALRNEISTRIELIITIIN